MDKVDITNVDELFKATKRTLRADGITKDTHFLLYCAKCKEVHYLSSDTPEDCFSNISEQLGLNNIETQ